MTFWKRPSILHIGVSDGVDIPPVAFGGCTCDCHRMPGVKHVMACCSPLDERNEVEEKIDSFEPQSPLGMP